MRTGTYDVLVRVGELLHQHTPGWPVATACGQRSKFPASYAKSRHSCVGVFPPPSRLSAILRKSAAAIGGLCRLGRIRPLSDTICALLRAESRPNRKLFLPVSPVRGADTI